MLDLGRVVYVDAQKTGSTFLTEFLVRNSGLPVLFQRKHSPLTAEIWERPDVTVFMTIREPAAYYESLFRFGLDGSGSISAALRARGLAHVYEPDEEHFRAFIRAVNDGRRWGLMTRRLTTITSLERPGQLTRRVSTGGGVRRRRRIHAVRMEHMAADLTNLAEQWEGFSRLGALIPTADPSIDRNASSGRGFRLSDAARAELRSLDGPLGDLERPVLDLYARWP